VRYDFKIQRIIAYNIICLLLLFFAQVAYSSSIGKLLKTNDSIDEFVVLGNNSVEVYADFDAEQEDTDSHFLNRFFSNAVKRHCILSYVTVTYEGIQLFASLIFIFHTDLPPPFIFS
jgi:hypothetical protein